MCMHGIYFFILCHHGEYSHGFLHTVDLLTWGLGFKWCNDGMQKQNFLFSFNM
jgi:hypothetical protein